MDLTKPSGQIQSIPYALRPFSASITFHPGAGGPGAARRRRGAGTLLGAPNEIAA